MKRSGQHGQSMTEYLVVLGVTGAALLASTSDVNTLFSNVRNGYENQSREMSKVQIYNNPSIRFNQNPSKPETGGDGDTPPPHNGTDLDGNELPSIDAQLGTFEMVYDQTGKAIGRMDGDMLVDDQGNRIGWCERSRETGECTFIDDNGNIIFPGASSDRYFADDKGNPLPMMALVSGKKVMGFAYLKNNKYYSSRDGKLLDPQPTGVSPKPMRQILDLKDGKATVAGYEYNGQIFSYDQVVTPFANKEQDPKKEELVSVYFTEQPSTKWDNYKPCLVMPAGWNSLYNTGEILSGHWANKFNDPSLRLSVGPLTGSGGFVNATADGCQGASSVQYNPAKQQWTLTK